MDARARGLDRHSTSWRASRCLASRAARHRAVAVTAARARGAAAAHARGRRRVSPRTQRSPSSSARTRALRDGIGEEDHAIPFWFKVAFGATIVFAVVYVAVLPRSPAGRRRASTRRRCARPQARASSVRAPRPTRIRTAATPRASPRARRSSRRSARCVTSPTASGLVGPSLVDPYWKYGHSDAELFETVSEGRPGGMPPWGTQLGDDKIWKVLAYLETLPKQSEPGIGAPGLRAGARAARPPPAAPEARAVLSARPVAGRFRAPAQRARTRC